MNAMNVEEDFLRTLTSVYIKKLILERNTMHAVNAGKPSQENQLSGCIRKSNFGGRRRREGKRSGVRFTDPDSSLIGC